MGKRRSVVTTKHPAVQRRERVIDIYQYYGQFGHKLSNEQTEALMKEAWGELRFPGDFDSLRDSGASGGVEQEGTTAERNPDAGTTLDREEAESEVTIVDITDGPTPPELD